MFDAMPAPRTYNQTHKPRKYVAGRRRISVYVSWTYPGETNQDTTILDNRYSTMTEVRRVYWPEYEWAEHATFLQGIAGSLELFFKAWMPFQDLIEETTGFNVPVYQRVDQAGYQLPLDERVLADTDTLLVFGLDMLRAEQVATAAEIEAVRQFLTREGTCLVLGPHHDVGHSNNMCEREEEYRHHGDALVPRQQRFAIYVRSLMKGLGVPVQNQWGLHPAVIEGGKEIAPLTIARDLDTRGFLEGVTSFNLHPHLPHYAVTTDDTKSIHVLAKQPIDMARPLNPFSYTGNTEFNACVWLPPTGDRAGDILMADSTIFSTLFGVSDSLKRFWLNLAR